MSEKILVLGASGFIGQHLVRALAQKGESVVAVGRRRIDFGMPGVEQVELALHDPSDFLPLLAQARAIVHLASASTPGSTAGRPLTELEDNLRPTLALLQALQSHPECQLLYVSSGGTLYGDTPDAPAHELSRLRPRSYYGAGKAAAEHFIDAWCNQFAAAATILRPSNVYGPGQAERRGFGIIPTAMGKILRQETLTVWGDGSTKRDYLYIDDFVELCTTILASKMAEGAQALNAASGIDTSLNTLFGQIEAVTGRPLPRTYAPDRTVDIARIALDPALARQLHGWSSATPLLEGLERTWAWFSANHH